MFDARRLGLVTIAALAALSGISTTSMATEAPAGIVMQVTGATSPSLSPWSEIPGDTAVRLAPGARLTFLHYEKCTVVTVAGGTVTLSRSDFVIDGKVESEKRGPCPTNPQLHTSGATAGGLITRGAPLGPQTRSEAARLPANPQILFTGARAYEVTAASLYAEGRPGRPVARVDLAAHPAKFEGAAAPIAPEARYVLKVWLGQGSQPVEFGFVGSPDAEGGSLVVLRID